LVAQLIRAKPEFGAIQLATLVKAFEHFGRRPQHFFNALQHEILQAQDASQLECAVLAKSEQQKSEQRDEFTQIYLALEPLEQALLQQMLENGAEFKPFSEQALAFYRQHTGQRVTVPQVQTALEGMRTDERRLVWKALRGEYVVYDQAMNDWYQYMLAARTWPPQVDGFDI
jgi:hypothetical protein